MFVTLYTDASFRMEHQQATLAWRGKCDEGHFQGTARIVSHDVNHAEMCAIHFAIADALERFPTLEGFFVNSDNLGCVKSFWTFEKFKVPATAIEVHAEIMMLVEHRWIRAKHVKAHTGRQDIRSHMNRCVDRATRAPARFVERAAVRYARDEGEE